MPSMVKGSLSKLKELTVRYCHELEEVIGGGFNSDLVKELKDSNVSSSSDNYKHDDYDDDMGDDDDDEYDEDDDDSDDNDDDNDIVDEGLSSYLPTTCVVCLRDLPNFRSVHPEGKMIGKIGKKERRVISQEPQD